MKISERDYFALSDAPTESTDFFIGPRWIARLSPGQKVLPLDSLVFFIDDLKRYGLSGLDLEKNQITRIDVSDFLLHFDGLGNLLSRMFHGTAAGKWQLYAFNPKKDFIHADIGLVLPATVPSDVGFRFVLNGQEEIDRIEHYDRHFSQNHWFMPSGYVRGMRVKFRGCELGDWARLSIVFEAPYDGLNQHFRDLWNFAHLGMLVDLPDLKRIHRVSSINSNQSSFLNGGKTAFENICNISERFGVDLRHGNKRVLDWGVGCGRLVRHFSKETDAQVTGIDIDSDNVSWCTTNLNGHFHTVDLRPPTVLGSSTFDCVYACSVLSHLSESDADSWLSEVARVLAPNGLALLSYNGISNSISYLSRRPRELQSVFDGALFDKDVNDELKGFIPSDDYYRQVFSSDAWWMSMFEKHFDVIGIEVSVLSGFQHVAVLRKKR
jgi:SAM-dependent methyltransferase